MIEPLSAPYKNRAIIFALGGWFCYILLDIFIYPLVVLSFSSNVVIITQGYDINYPSLFIANILRDVAFSGLLVQCWGFLFGSLAIRYGERKTAMILRNKVIIGFIIVSSILILYFDYLIVIVTENTIIIIENFSPFGVIAIFMAISLYFTSTFLLGKVLKSTITREVNFSESERAKVENILFGALLMGVGYLWYFFWNVYFQVMTLDMSAYENRSIFLSISYMLHAFWSLSAIFIYKGFILSSNQNKI